MATYLNLLSKVFIIFKVEGFNRNLRKEIVKSNRWYFYDNGIRNGIINNFNRLDSRTDVGDLWENYLAAERVKKQNYLKIKTNNYFWFTYDQQELDWLKKKEKNWRDLSLSAVKPKKLKFLPLSPKLIQMLFLK